MKLCIMFPQFTTGFINYYFEALLIYHDCMVEFQNYDFKWFFLLSMIIEHGIETPKLNIQIAYDFNN